MTSDDLSWIHFRHLLVGHDISMFHIPCSELFLFYTHRATCHWICQGIVDPNGDQTSLLWTSTLASGEALPPWLHFDTVKHEWWGTAPYEEEAGHGKILVVRVGQTPPIEALES